MAIKFIFFLSYSIEQKVIETKHIWQSPKETKDVKGLSSDDYYDKACGVLSFQYYVL